MNQTTQPRRYTISSFAPHPFIQWFAEITVADIPFVGGKEFKLVYDSGGGKMAKNVPVSPGERAKPALTDDKLLQLARWDCIVPDHQERTAHRTVSGRGASRYYHPRYQAGFAQFLVEQSIDSISLNPDTVLKTTLAILEQENTLKVT